MKYKQIVKNAIVENQENNTSYFSYFVRQAKIAEQEKYKPADFYEGCIYVIGLYKEIIISNYEKSLSGFNILIRESKKAIERGHTKDQNGESFQSNIDSLEREKLFVKNRGYKTNFDFGCELDKDGNISERINDTKIIVRWYEVQQIEEGLLQAKQEILPIPTDSSITSQSIQMELPKKVLNFLADNQCENGKAYIEKVTSYPLKWLQTKQLARELLTHNKIKGTLRIAEVEEEAKLIFMDKDNKPLRLAKNKSKESNDSDKLSKFLATL